MIRDDFEMQKITFATFWKDSFKMALKETGVLACLATTGGAVLSFALLWWLNPNKRPDVPEAIGVAIAGGICGLILEFTVRFLFFSPVKMAGELNAENLRLETSIQAYKQKERLQLDANEFVPAFDLDCYSGGFDIETMQPTSHKFTMGVERATLKCLCHNLTNTPAILREIIMNNADSGELIVRQDANARRIEANNTAEITFRLELKDAPRNQTPKWRGQIIVKTVRGEEFASEPINFAGLVKHSK